MITNLKELVSQGKSIREIAKEAGRSPTSVRYQLKKLDLKTNKNKTGFRCGTCGETDPSAFYGHKKRVCGVCHSKYTLAKGQEKREKAIEYLGGKCVSCGFDKFKCSLDIHHLDPSKKDESFASHRGWSWERLLNELKGCKLLCKNCHTALHAGHLSLE